MQIMYIASTIMQLCAAFLALLYIRKSPYLTWLFVGLALLPIGLKKLLTLVTITLPPSLLYGIIASFMILGGVFVLYKIFIQFKQSITHLKSLRAIDHVMLSSLSQKGVMNAIIDKLNATLDTDAAAVLTITNSNNSYGLNTFVSYNLSKKLQEFIQTSSNGFVASVIDNRKPLVISKIDDDEDENFLTTLKDEGFASYMASPIIVRRSMPIGVLTLYSKKPRRYTKEEIEFINSISDQIAITIDRTHLLGRIQELNFESVRALVEAIELRDPYTRGHSIQVADLAVVLAKAMGLPEKELPLIEFAGLLHDIGKIAVPETILKKKDTLTKEEWKTIKKHPSHSAKIIEPVLNLKPIQDWILHHHERWDGRGYPSGQKEREIPIESRILAVCDTYSAMLEDRPYRRGLAPGQIRREMHRVAGTQLDPIIVDTFFNLDLDEINSKSSQESMHQGQPINNGNNNSNVSLRYSNLNNAPPLNPTEA